MDANRNNLDLKKSADRLTAQANAFAEDLGLYKRYAAANAVSVGKVPLMD